MASPPRIEPALRMPLLSASVGTLAAAALAVLLPPVAALPAALVVLGLASLSALIVLDRQRKRELDALAYNVGELNIRLGHTRIKLDGLQSRVDSEPLREADIAPTRASLAELTAEVGLLGGVLRDVANAVADHEGKLAEVAAKAPEPAKAAPQPAAAAGPALTAQPDQIVDAELAKRDEARLARLLAAFSANGLEVHLQPIVSLPHRRTVGYEALARLRLDDGSLLMPTEFIAALERAGQGSSLDAQVLTQALAIAGHLNAKGQDHFVSINLSAGTWAEQRALGSIAKVLEAYRAQSARLVIEVPQRTFRKLDPTKLGILGAMAANGIRFAIDQVSDLRFDPTALADRGVRFVKAPIGVIASFDEHGGLDIALSDLAMLMRRSGVELIGERAETDRLVADLIDLDIGMAQGFAISAPKPVKPDVFQPAETPAARARAASGELLGEPAAPMRQPGSGVDGTQAPTAPTSGELPQRVPLRAVLRRA